MKLHLTNYGTHDEFQKLRAVGLNPKLGIFRKHTLVIYSQTSKTIFGKIANVVKAAFYHLLILFRQIDTNKKNVNKLVQETNQAIFTDVNKVMIDQITSLRLQKEGLETEVEGEEHHLDALKAKVGLADKALAILDKRVALQAEVTQFMDEKILQEYDRLTLLVKAKRAELD